MNKGWAIFPAFFQYEGFLVELHKIVLLFLYTLT